MKTSFLVLALSFAVAAQADDYRFKEAFSRTAPFNPTGEVTLTNVNGDVAIQTWDKNEIRVEGEKSAKTEEELKQIELTIDLTPAKAAIQTHLPRRDGFWSGGTIRAAVRFTITVPATAVLSKIETVNSSVMIESVRGPVNARTVNGAIHATGLSSDASLHTVNGSVHASFAAVSAGRKIVLKTTNGSIHVAIPKDAGLALSSHTVNGHVDCALPLQLGEKHHHSLSGTIGDGRATLDADSVNGSVHIESL